jgi:hypothetical protein
LLRAHASTRLAFQQGWLVNLLVSGIEENTEKHQHEGSFLQLGISSGHLLLLHEELDNIIETSIFEENTCPILFHLVKFLISVAFYGKAAGSWSLPACPVEVFNKFNTWGVNVLLALFHYSFYNFQIVNLLVNAASFEESLPVDFTSCVTAIFETQNLFIHSPVCGEHTDQIPHLNTYFRPVKEAEESVKLGLVF